MNPPDVVIIGGGLAGLSCAVRLAEQGKSFRLLEASNSLGGRVQTDELEGFRLDRGFQIFLTAYPEAQRVLEYDDLKLKPFTRGSLVRYRGRFHRLTDPRKEPLNALSALFCPLGTFRDKWRLFRLHSQLARAGDDPFREEDSLTLDFLRWQGRFSEEMIDGFFRPFLGGVFLEKKLITSSRFFRFVYRMFAAGEATIPERGMQAIPQQLASRLPAESIRLKARVERIENTTAVLPTGEPIRGKSLVIATDGIEAARLSEGRLSSTKWNGVTTCYYTMETPPLTEPILLLDGENRGPVNHAIMISAANPDAAPKGQHLLSASVIGLPESSDAELDRQIRSQFLNWFGPQVSSWRLLKTYRLAESLPKQQPLDQTESDRGVRLREGVYLCGDHRENSSINGAMVSGFRAAQAILEDERRPVVAGQG
jgi:phytoene dehydrogenase-like protein